MIEKGKIKAYALDNAILHNGKAASGSVINALFAEGLKKDEIKEIAPIVNEIVESVNSLSLEEQKKQYDKLKEVVKKRELRVGLPELENAEQGKVIMRLAPFPSGPLHIGNARPYIINDEYVKKYNGKLLLVIDDTISGEAKPVEPEAYKLIPEGFDWLGINYDKKIIYKSDRNEIYYKYAEELIKKGYMYACSCTQEEFQKLKLEQVECPCRNLPIEKHIERWNAMFKKETLPGSLVIRLKTSMQDSDPAFRDRVMFRISDKPHPKVGRKYKVWPLLDFSWAIDDYLLEITHILRGMDLVMETRVEKFIWDIFKWKHPVVFHTGFFQIEGVKISKSKGAKEVRSGEYIGWNDPRLWSLQSLRDRGIKPEAIREFILSQGITKSNSTVAIDILYALNRKFLEKSKRYFFVPNPTKIKISACPEINASLPLHPSEKIGFRKYKTKQEFFISTEDSDFMENKNYRLMHLLNFKSMQVSKTEPRHFSFISQEPDEKLGVKFIQWLAADEGNKKDLFETIVRMPDNSIVKGLAESEISNLKKGDCVQFERFGFVCVYNIDKNSKKAEFWFSHR